MKMKRIIAALSITAATVFTWGMLDKAGATPSTTYWTPSTSDVQPYKVYHIGIDNYFTTGRKGDSSALPTDVGLTVGVLPYEKLQLEVGVDFMGHSTDPVMFNAKLGAPEGALFADSPALNLGIFSVGTDRKDAATDGDARTDYNILDIIIGKTLPANLGRIHAGVYSGNKKALLNGNGVEEDSSGYMIGWDLGVAKTKDASGNEYAKWIFAADYASGKNAIGGGGVGAYYFFTKDISLLTGPVWFNDPAAVGVSSGAKWVWTTQLDINL